MIKKFYELKKEALSIDKSHKQSWDKPIVPLLNLLNERPDTCTISSCSGRIVLMEYNIPKEEEEEEEEERKERKYDAKFLFSSHESNVDYEDILKTVESAPFSPERTIWFQQEPVILHIRFLELNKDVKEVVKIFRTIGFKKSGIFGFEEGKVLLEVVGLEIMKIIIMKNGIFLPSKEYFKLMVEEANKRVRRGHEKIQKSIFQIQNYFIRRRISIINEFWFGEELKYIYRQKLRRKYIEKTRRPNFKKPLFRRPEERNKRVQIWKESVLLNNPRDDSLLQNLIKEKTDFFKELYNHLWIHHEHLTEMMSWFENSTSILALLISFHLFKIYNNLTTNEEEEEEKRISVVFEELEKKIHLGLLERDLLLPPERLFLILIFLKNSEEVEDLEKGKKMLLEMIDSENSIFPSDKTNVYELFL